ncbi:IS3 family transposase, partial [Aliarcobacter butzleri]|uniref:IS3 family transposase n=1 Tax=Aliarcobacter butzleri TaxID=28197 RepID=UPI000ACFA228
VCLTDKSNLKCSLIISAIFSIFIFLISTPKNSIFEVYKFRKSHLLNLILIIGFYLLVSGLRPFYCPVELRFCVRPHSDIGVQFRPIFAVMTTDSNHSLPIAPNILNRDFYASKVDEKYVGDITYIPTSEGWLYLATVIDLYSRKIVGWSMDETMKVSLVNDALKMALISRNPDKGLIWHTDRGSQYASYEHKDLLKRHGIIQSMSRKGNCHDNAVAESFFHTLKTELIHHEIYHTKEQAKRSIFEYIEVFYNRERSHSANNNLSPVEFEERQKLLQKEIVA